MHVAVTGWERETAERGAKNVIASLVSMIGADFL